MIPFPVFFLIVSLFVLSVTFQFLPLCDFPSFQCFSAPFTCPFPAAHQVYLSPLLVCLYVVFVLPHVFVCSFRFRPNFSVMKPCVSHWHYLQFLPVSPHGMFPFFVPCVFIDLYFDVCTLLQSKLGWRPGGQD